jgi:hypothetical protein
MRLALNRAEAPRPAAMRWRLPVHVRHGMLAW